MEIFIDLSTGTWGAAEDIIFTYITMDEVNDLESMTALDIIDWARKFGSMK